MRRRAPLSIETSISEIHGNSILQYSTYLKRIGYTTICNEIWCTCFYDATWAQPAVASAHQNFSCSTAPKPSCTNPLVLLVALRFCKFRPKIRGYSFVFYRFVFSYFLSNGAWGCGRSRTQTFENVKYSWTIGWWPKPPSVILCASKRVPGLPCLKGFPLHEHSVRDVIPQNDKFDGPICSRNAIFIDGKEKRTPENQIYHTKTPKR